MSSGAVDDQYSRNLVAKLRAARERKIAVGGRGSGRFAYPQKVPQVVALVRELHGQRQSLRQISKTLASQGHLTGGDRRQALHCDCGAEDAARRVARTPQAYCRLLRSSAYSM
jgi:hypothetical protein